MFLGQLACEAPQLPPQAPHQRRPPPPPAHHHPTPLGKGYGMPSSHAQFACFWAVAVALFLTVRSCPLPPHTPPPTARQRRNRRRSPRWQTCRGRTARGGCARPASRSKRTRTRPGRRRSARRRAAGGGRHGAGGVEPRVPGVHSVRQVVAGCVAGAGVRDGVVCRDVRAAGDGGVGVGGWRCLLRGGFG